MYDLGAEIILDYHDPQVGDSIRDLTDDSLDLVLDIVSTPQSAAICATAISSTGGSNPALLDICCPRTDIETQVSMAYYAMIGKRYSMGKTQIEGAAKDFDFAVQWANVVEI